MNGMTPFLAAAMVVTPARTRLIPILAIDFYAHPSPQTMTTKTSQVLALIEKTKRHLSATEIGEHLGWSPTQAGYVVQALCQNEFLTMADKPVLATYKRTAKPMPTPMGRDRKGATAAARAKVTAALALPANPFNWRAQA